MKSKLSFKFTLTLTLLSLIGQIAWVVENMYLNVFIYKMFHASAADISLMVAASAVTATLTTVFIGALSDRLGKRRVFICGGYILWGISILGFALLRLDLISAAFPSAASAASLGVSLVIALDCLMTFFGASANDASFNAWLTDSTDATNRGAAEGINAMMPLVAI
ncbi:MAG: MFS transporter, partial [Clostridia bacterium]|nr:MFS transporter [Clostridia bacterium]